LENNFDLGYQNILFAFPIVENFPPAFSRTFFVYTSLFFLNYLISLI